VIWIGIVISFISRMICSIIYINGHSNWMWGAYFTPNLILPLAIGALLAYIRSEEKYAKLLERLSKKWLVYAAWIAYAVIFYLCRVIYNVSFYHELFDEYLFAIACFFLILQASQNKFRHAGKYILEHDVVTFTGKISYGLYLYHLFVIGFFWNYLSPVFQLHTDNKHTAWLLYFIIAYILAIASYFIIEQPLNRLKRYFKY
jgi:peptidoglycan/LPS O-acetylase OafA/YrhL